MVKPTKSLFDVDAKSVRKKMKDKAFAKGVNRDDVMLGVQELGVDLDTHIQFVIEAMRSDLPASRAPGPGTRPTEHQRFGRGPRL